MKKILMAKCGELVLKGLNRRVFENRLLSNLKKALINEFETISIKQSAIYINLKEDIDFTSAVEKTKKVFGITSISIVYEIEKDMEVIKNTALELLQDILPYNTFKVEAKRSDKDFYLGSPEICMEVGGHLFENIENVKVDVKNPNLLIKVEIREKAYIYFEKEECYGGLPVGTSGKGTLLLSGGIDSPVAGFMMAKRGLELNCVHFYSYPYTSERAKQKVITLAKIISAYTGGLKLYIIPFTKIQEEIRDQCDGDMMTLVMRRFMMKIAEKIALKTGSQALITGESLGQVASQTIGGLTVTNRAVELPVFRPLIGMDKNEITIISRKMEAFETSILPYEDCCTVFTPKHPKTKPKLFEVEAQEQRIDMENLINIAVDNVEIIIL